MANNNVTRWTRRGWLLALAALVGLWLAGCSREADKPLVESHRSDKHGTQHLMLFVPCSIFTPFCTPFDEYRAAHPDVTIDFDNGNSVVLKRKVMDKGERPDVYIGTGPLEIDPLIEAGLIEDGSLRELSADTVILTAPKANPAKIARVEDLATDRVKLIAIPDPKLNSSGKFAVEAFQKLGLWDRIKDKVQFTEFGRTSRRYVIEGKLDASVMYRSCLYEELKPGEDIEAPGEIAVIADLLALAKMPEIPTRGGVLKASADKPLAQGFLDFLAQPSSRKVFDQWRTIRCPVAQPAPAAVAATPAKVIVRAFYPLNEEHQFVADYINSLPAKFGPDMAVEVTDFRKADGYKKWRASGLTCGGVLVNGEYRAEVTLNGKTRKVQFLRRPGGDWEQEELEAAIAQALAAAKAAPAPTAKK